MILRIVGPNFVVGAVVEDGKVTEVAPLLRFMRGWPERRVLEYVARRHWTVDRLADPPDTSDIPETSEAWFQKARVKWP
jgi:hypothetical protein